MKSHLNSHLPTILPFLLLLANLCCCAVAKAASPENEAIFKQKAAPLLKQFCFDCHGPDTAEANFNVASYPSAQAILEGRSQWLKAAAKIRAGQMPPEDSDAPTDQQREFLAQWLETAANDIDCSGSPNPGRVTLRRLNRTEYRNTVRDLTGVDFEPADDFPGDDVGYGFDNIGDVLSLPPLLMEKYLAAAEQIATQAIHVGPPPGLLDRRIKATDMKQTNARDARGAGIVFTSLGRCWVELDIPLDGKYELRAFAGGDQAGEEPARVTFMLGDTRLENVDVPTSKDEPKLHTITTEIKHGSHKIGVGFFNDYYNPKAKDPKRRDRNLYVQYIEIHGPIDKPVEYPAAHKRIVVVTPSEKVTQRDALQQVLTRLTSRAFRRPAKQGEVDRLIALAEIAIAEEDSFEAGIRLAMQALLASPHFLFKVESPTSPGKDRLLTEYELATSLSYFLWSSMPDNELFTLAWEGKLREQLEPQVKRMLASPKADQLVANFAGQWLQLRNLADATPDADLFPSFNEGLRQAMQQETELFVADVMRSDSSIFTLLDANYTYLNEPLAKHYGVPGVQGEGFRKVALTEDAAQVRGGLLTHASILTVTSSPTRTSPVQRGKWVLENLFNEPPPPPAPDIPSLEEQKELTGTLRQRMEQHRANPACATCHQVMDPLGFALENFDPIGAWRTKDEGAPIDASGELPSGEKFRGPRELNRLLLQTKKDAFARCFAEKLLTFALGRGIEYYDICAVEEILKSAGKSDHRFSSFILGVVRSTPFQKRRS